MNGQEYENDANLPHKTLLPLASETLNTAGTMAVLSAQETAKAAQETAKAQGDVWQAVTETKSVYLTQSAYLAETATMQAPLATARADALGTQNFMVLQNMTQSAANATQTYSAPHDAATAIYLSERTKWAGFDAFAMPFGALTGGIGVLVLALLAVYVIATRPQVAHVEYSAPSTSPFIRPWVPTSPTGFVTKAIPVSDGDMCQFMEYAVTGLPLGENSMVKAGAWKSGASDRHKRQEIMAYLDKDCGHIKDHKLTPQGVDYWQDWLDAHTPRPAPSAEVVENDDVPPHEHVNNDHVDDGEVVVAPEIAQFMPQDMTYAALMPKEEGEQG